jgi:hypothetical protein
MPEITCKRSFRSVNHLVSYNNLCYCANRWEEGIGNKRIGSCVRVLGFWWAKIAKSLLIWKHGQSLDYSSVKSNVGILRLLLNFCRDPRTHMGTTYMRRCTNKHGPIEWNQVSQSIVLCRTASISTRYKPATDSPTDSPLGPSYNWQKPDLQKSLEHRSPLGRRINYLKGSQTNLLIVF